MAKQKNTLQKVAIGTAVAGAAGYLVGVLSAPKAGKKTRKQLKKTADRNIAELEKQIKDLHAELGDIMGDAKKQGDKLTDQGQKKFGPALDGAVSAKNKLRDVISTIQDGKANDKDLSKALQDAKRSLDHLKHFLKK